MMFSSPHRTCRTTLVAAAAALTLGFGAVALLPLPAAQADPHAEAGPVVTRAIAILQPTEGNDATHGEIHFEALEDGNIRITGTVHGLKPDSYHGFHVHEFGDLSKPDGTGTGGHFNPEGHDHSLPGHGDERHAGDLGNIVANAEGVGTLDFSIDGITLAPGKTCILGRGLIVHAGKDDGGQPAGNAGPRIAQGVIGVAAAETKKAPSGY